jgi:hypothetical protein
VVLLFFFPNTYNTKQSQPQLPHSEVIAGRRTRRDAEVKQARLIDHGVASDSNTQASPRDKRTPSPSTRFTDIDGKDCSKDPLWPYLVEATKRNPLYSGWIGYAREKVLPNDPNITARQLACMLSISVGEALVLLHDAQQSK